jgi:hypothetical protein
VFTACLKNWKLEPKKTVCFFGGYPLWIGGEGVLFQQGARGHSSTNGGFTPVHELRTTSTRTYL